MFALFAFSGLHCLSPLISWLVSSSLRHTFIMSYLPKTPSHRHRSRSETKTPLTPSLASGINALNLGIPRQGSHSPTKGKADVSFNPFLSSRPSSPVKRAQSTSRPASPIKRATTGSLQVSDTLQRQASSGLIRKGGVESRIDVITRDYVPPKTQKRSRSQPNVSNTFISGLFHFRSMLPFGEGAMKFGLLWARTLLASVCKREQTMTLPRQSGATEAIKPNI